MKIDLLIQGITAAKTDLLAMCALAAGMVFHNAPGYALGAALATVAFWLISRKKCPSDRMVVMIFTFCAGAWGVPLVANMDALAWVPRPDPMVGEWEALAGLIGGSIGGTALYAFVLRINRRATAAADALADMVSKRAGFPEAGETTTPDLPKMSAAEFAEMLGTLPAEHREAILAYRRRAADPARAATREKHLPRD